MLPVEDPNHTVTVFSPFVRVILHVQPTPLVYPELVRMCGAGVLAQVTIPYLVTDNPMIEEATTNHRSLLTFPAMFARTPMLVFATARQFVY